MNSIQPAQAQAYRLQGALVNQETGVRGYGITGDPRFLQPYTSGRATEQAAGGSCPRSAASSPWRETWAGSSGPRRAAGGPATPFR